jgi:Protein of unknown function (DUF1573)
MRKSIHRRSLLALPLVLLMAGPVLAQEVVTQDDPYLWAKKMFESTTPSHDFGAVARGAEVSYRFKVTNLYAPDAHIASVTTSCGCTAPSYDQTPFKSHQSTFITISMDTNRFQHDKGSTVTVTFDQPQYAVVQIPVKVYIRTDVVLTPGSINFGAVDHGAAQDRKIQLAYAGDPNWAVTKVVTNNEYLKADVKETRRDNGQVGYDLSVALSPKAPVGYLRQQILLKTNDEAKQIPILVQARIESDVTVTPSVVQLGSVAPGAEAVKTVLLRGHNPFVIEKIECESAHGLFKMPQLTKDAKTVHILPLTFTAPKEAGALSETFIVTIAGRKDPITFTATGTIETAQQITPR